MSSAVLVSLVILWVLVIGLALAVFALARQVGVLHERIAPAGALQPTHGPKVGELTEPIKLQDINDRPLTIGGPMHDTKGALILFLSPTCPVCRTLVPTVRSMARAENLALVFASDGGELEQHIAYVDELGINDYPYVLSEALGRAYQVAKLPFALLIDEDGVLRSKGLVNNREHLESMVEAMETGVATLQDYVSTAQGGGGLRMKEQTQ